jgi:hypothetical protein
VLRFPLFERAERLGVLDGGSALIVAPTATGKSPIGHMLTPSADGKTLTNVSGAPATTEKMKVVYDRQ